LLTLIRKILGGRPGSLLASVRIASGMGRRFT
jgi:hypothetical protein